MTLFHGSTVAVRKPRLLPSARALDFGAGFYLTSDREQAEKWARLMYRRRQMGCALLSVYSVDDVALAALNVLRFSGPDGVWLRYISANRKEKGQPYDYDVVIGPVANDNTMPVIHLYLRGDYDEEEAIKRLFPQQLKNQFAFKTERALALLAFAGKVAV